MIVGWWAVGCRLLSIFYHLSSIFFPLSADWYLPAFETLTARTEILRFAQNDDARRTAESGWRSSPLSAVGCRLSAVSYRLSAIVCYLSSIIYHLSSIIYHLSSIFFPLSADRYLPAFETLTAHTEILRFAQNDDVRRTAESGWRSNRLSAIG